MTDLEKVEMVKALINDPSVEDNTIAVYLSLACKKVLERCYPFAKEEKPMPPKYDLIQIELASRYILRRGVEGQVGSAENGITRQYATVNDEDLLKEVMQVIGVR